MLPVLVEGDEGHAQAVRAVRAGHRQDREFVLTGHTRQRFEQRAAGPAIDGRGGADAQGQRRDRDEREHRLPREQPHREQNVAPHAIDEGACPDLPDPFLHLFDPAQFDRGMSERLVRRQALGALLFGKRVNRGRKFRIEVPFDGVAAHQIAQGRQETMDHGSSSSVGAVTRLRIGIR